MTLAELGWDEGWERAFAPWASRPDVQPARVAIEFNHILRVHADAQELDASTSGRLKHRAENRGQLPADADAAAVGPALAALLVGYGILRLMTGKVDLTSYRAGLRAILDSPATGDRTLEA